MGLALHGELAVELAWMIFTNRREGEASKGLP